MMDVNGWKDTNFLIDHEAGQGGQVVPCRSVVSTVKYEGTHFLGSNEEPKTEV